MNEADRQTLIGFVNSTESDMILALDHLPEPNVTALAQAAWSDLGSRGEFDKVRALINSRAFDDRFDAFGLAEPQLGFKLAVINSRRDDVSAAQNAPEQPEEQAPPTPATPPERPRHGRRLRRLIAKLLDAIDVVLESLVRALHGVGELD